jgi:hypothetical protein
MPSLDSDELARLSPEERLALIGQLWDSLRDTEVPLPEGNKQNCPGDCPVSIKIELRWSLGNSCALSWPEAPNDTSSSARFNSVVLSEASKQKLHIP